VVFRDLILNAKVVEQQLGTGVLSHHNPQASVNGDEEEHRQNACLIPVGVHHDEFVPDVVPPVQHLARRTRSLILRLGLTVKTHSDGSKQSDRN
jgi:hypothetical protein